MIDLQREVDVTYALMDRARGYDVNIWKSQQ